MSPKYENDRFVITKRNYNNFIVLDVYQIWAYIENHKYIAGSYFNGIFSGEYQILESEIIGYVGECNAELELIKLANILEIDKFAKLTDTNFITK